MCFYRNQLRGGARAWLPGSGVGGTLRVRSGQSSVRASQTGKHGHAKANITGESLCHTGSTSFVGSRGGSLPGEGAGRERSLAVVAPPSSS